MFSSKLVKAVTLTDADGNKIFIYDPCAKISSIRAFSDNSIIQMENGDTYMIKKPLKELVKFLYGC